MSRAARSILFSRDEALTELRRLHKHYVRSCGAFFRHVKFRATAVPGWVYVPKTDTVIPADTGTLARQAAPSKARSTTRRQVARSTSSASLKVRPASTVPSKVRTSRVAPRVRPTTRRTLRVLGGRRVLIEGFGKRSPTFIAIGGNGEAPAGAWLSPAELQRFIDVARRILK